MAESDDEEFLIIFNNNNLDELFPEEQHEQLAPKEVELTIENLQDGLADLCNLTAFISAFLMDFFTAFKEGDLENVPKMKAQMISELLDLFKRADCLIELIDVESEDDEQEEE